MASSPLLKLLLLLSCLFSLSFAIAYLHPFLLPFLTLTLPRLWSSLQRRFTAPVLFVLLNLVVAALYLSSGMMPRPRKIQDDAALDDSSTEPDPINRRSSSRRDEKPAAARSDGKLFVPAHVRLFRSKSDQVLPPKKTEAGASRLKKSGTFEATSHSKPRSGVVVGDYPENDSGHIESAEVDKQAEDFIGRFKQKMKLQRLDSLIRYQERLNKSYGPP